MLAVLLLLRALATLPPDADRVRGCIDPAVESMSWRGVEGKLVSVRSARRFVLRTANGREVSVSIANVGEPPAADASAATEALGQLLAGKRIEVLANWSYEVDTPAELTGEVHVPNDDVAERLLAAGVVRFVEEKPYQLSQHSECVHRNAEAYARKLHRGVWAEAK